MPQFIQTTVVGRPLAAAPNSLFVVANQIEGVFWGTLGLACAISAIRRRVVPVHDGWLAAIALVAFGVSDWVEARTGAWYDPWWLLAWKAGCVVTLLVIGRLQWRRRRIANGRSEQDRV